MFIRRTAEIQRCSIYHNRLFAGWLTFAFAYEKHQPLPSRSEPTFGLHSVRIHKSNFYKLVERLPVTPPPRWLECVLCAVSVAGQQQSVARSASTAACPQLHRSVHVQLSQHEHTVVAPTKNNRPLSRLMQINTRCVYETSGYSETVNVTRGNIMCVCMFDCWMSKKEKKSRRREKIIRSPRWRNNIAMWVKCVCAVNDTACFIFLCVDGYGFVYILYECRRSCEIWASNECDFRESRQWHWSEHLLMFAAIERIVFNMQHNAKILCVMAVQMVVCIAECHEFSVSF